jgi:hypothetical protein
LLFAAFLFTASASFFPFSTGHPASGETGGDSGERDP